MRQENTCNCSNNRQFLHASAKKSMYKIQHFRPYCAWLGIFLWLVASMAACKSDKKVAKDIYAIMQRFTINELNKGRYGIDFQDDEYLWDNPNNFYQVSARDSFLVLSTEDSTELFQWLIIDFESRDTIKSYTSNSLHIPLEEMRSGLFEIKINHKESIGLPISKLLKIEGGTSIASTAPAPAAAAKKPPTTRPPLSPEEIERRKRLEEERKAERERKAAERKQKEEERRLEESERKRERDLKKAEEEAAKARLAEERRAREDQKKKEQAGRIERERRAAEEGKDLFRGDKKKYAYGPETSPGYGVCLSNWSDHLTYEDTYTVTISTIQHRILSVEAKVLVDYAGRMEIQLQDREGNLIKNFSQPLAQGIESTMIIPVNIQKNGVYKLVFKPISNFKQERLGIFNHGKCSDIRSKTPTELKAKVDLKNAPIFTLFELNI